MSEDLKNKDFKIVRASDFKAMDGGDKNFTGRVHISGYFAAPEPSKAGVGIVNFDVGARTNWHTHPVGQILVVTHGVGWHQCEGGPKHEIREGDIIWCNCGRRHWHGATDKTSMQHIAINEHKDGSVVDWMEPVTDEQFLETPVTKD
ncbi:MAG: cupin [Alteromonadaceae bacterium]|nr:cupin [Alteromonadaceae bacterium]MBT82720.1 cupin [Alteromonadaceae bacterium]